MEVGSLVKMKMEYALDMSILWIVLQLRGADMLVLCMRTGYKMWADPDCFEVVA